MQVCLHAADREIGMKICLYYICVSVSVNLCI